MTVKKLIQELQKLDPQALVVQWCNLDGAYTNVSHVDTLDLQKSGSCYRPDESNKRAIKAVALIGDLE